LNSKLLLGLNDSEGRAGSHRAASSINNTREKLCFTQTFYGAAA
jgi:hypothetical protein